MFFFFAILIIQFDQINFGINQNICCLNHCHTSAICVDQNFLLHSSSDDELIEFRRKYFFRNHLLSKTYFHKVSFFVRVKIKLKLAKRMLPSNALKYQTQNIFYYKF